MFIPNIFTDKKPAWGACLAVTALYVIIIFTGITHHELWMDEAHHFLMALNSNTISDLLYNARHEGHPFWNTVLFTLTRFTNNTFYMQVANVVFSGIVVLIFLRRAPFSFLFKLLFIAGYFMIYEYSIISRNYALGCVFLFTVLAIYPVRKQHRLAYAIPLAVLTNVHLFVTPIAIVLMMQMLWEYFCDFKAGKKNNYLPVVIALCGLALAVYTAIPPPADRFLYMRVAPPVRVELPQVLSMPFRGIFFMPDITSYNCWNTNLFTANCWSYCRWLFPLPALLGLIVFWRKPFSLFFFWVAGSAMVFIGFFSIGYASRHCGFIYMAFTSALWISYYEKAKVWNKKFKMEEDGSLPFKEIQNEGGGAQQNNLMPPVVAGIIWAILIMHVVSGCIMYVKDFKLPFSESKEVSEYLVKQSLGDKFIIVSHQNIGPSVSAYMHRKLFHAENGWEGTYRYWNARPNFVNDSALLVKVNEQLSTHDTIVLLLDHELTTGSSTAQITPLNKFNRAILKAENYFVYLVQPKGK